MGGCMSALQDTEKNVCVGVELHLHLDGCLTPQLLTSILGKKGGTTLSTSEQELYDKITIPERVQNLETMLAVFEYFLPLIRDADVLEELAYNVVKRQKDNDVYYTEVRFSPHVLSGEDLDCDAVITAIHKGIKRGMEEFDVIIKLILCVMRHLPIAKGFEVVELVKKYEHLDVVGIDLAGDEASFPNENFIKVFDKANEYDLNVTIHAGEASGAQSVESALNKLKAHRIGHGYRVLGDEKIYQDVLDKFTCLECCPTSSIRTGAVSENWREHPLNKFVKDGANWCISTDDPGVFDINFAQEVCFSCVEFGIDEEQLYDSYIRAMKSSFCPEKEKSKILSILETRMGYETEIEV